MTPAASTVPHPEGRCGSAKNGMEKKTCTQNGQRSRRAIATGNTWLSNVSKNGAIRQTPASNGNVGNASRSVRGAGLKINQTGPNTTTETIVRSNVMSQKKAALGFCLSR